MKKTEQEHFLQRLLELWSKTPGKRFGHFIVEVSKNPTELYLIDDKELLKRLEKETT
jgi:hypothetical protein